MPMPELDQATLRQILDYCPNTGAFAWRPRPGNARWSSRYAGKAAGYSWTPRGSKTAYWVIRVFDWPFLAHRLAFLYVIGRWPSLVDHADGDGLNNSWGNLREATRAENSANADALSNNKIGYRGVSLHKSSGRYRAVIKLDGRQRFLGHFDTPEEARDAYVVAASEAYGRFARAK